MHTDEEIEYFIKYSLTEFKLTEREQRRYFKFIRKIDKFINNEVSRHKRDIFYYIEEKLENLYARFIQEGFSEEQSIELSKNALLFSDRSVCELCLDFMRVCNIEVEAINSNTFIYKNQIEKAHARKMYLVKTGFINEQTANILLKCRDKDFERRFNTNIIELTNKYPITEEIKQILSYLASFTDEKLRNELGVTKEQLSYIYPTTIDELNTLKMLAKLNDEEIIKRYGITREKLLMKYPVNKDTLSALKSINQSSNAVINKVMNQPKEEVLHLRTITTEMIKQANRRVKLQKIIENNKVKSMKKGTIN